MNPVWTFARLERLSSRDVFDVLALRASVFVVEQNCVFLDPDSHDVKSWHLLGRDANGRLIAYLRIVDAGQKYDEPSIGRVATHIDYRRLGIGLALMHEGLRRCAALWPEASLRIGAQERLERFYQRLGFARASERYIEDGIAHIEMVRRHEPRATHNGDTS